MSNPRVKIHPTAVIEGDVNFQGQADIGPLCVLRGPITLGDGVRLISSVNLMGPLTVGDRTIFYPGANIGMPPQDYKFAFGSPTPGVTIGEDCIIREGTTIHSATKPERPTILGNKVFMMVNSHVGHDARIDDEVILVNGALVAGHAHMGRKSTLSGNAALHQFGRIGRLAFVSGSVAATRDVPPFCLTASRERLTGLNDVGLRRSGMPRAEITLLREAFRKVFRVPMARPEMVSLLREYGQKSEAAGELADFISTSKRAIMCAYAPRRAEADVLDPQA